MFESRPILARGLLFTVVLLGLGVATDVACGPKVNNDACVDFGGICAASADSCGETLPYPCLSSGGVCCTPSGYTPPKPGSTASPPTTDAGPIPTSDASVTTDSSPPAEDSSSPSDGSQGG
jgi:hypothetical protein